MALRTATDVQSIDTFASKQVPCSGVLIASGDYKATDPTPVEFSPPNLAGSLNIVFNVTAQSGAGNTITANVEGWDKASNTWVALAAGIADTTAGAHVKILRVNPYIATAASDIGATLFETMRLRPVGSGTRTTLNYSVSANFSS